MRAYVRAGAGIFRVSPPPFSRFLAKFKAQLGAGRGVRGFFPMFVVVDVVVAIVFDSLISSSSPQNSTK